MGTIWLAEKGNGTPDGAGLVVGRGAWLLSDPYTKAHRVEDCQELGLRFFTGTRIHVGENGNSLA
jgi:hypothetical protein